MEKIRRILCYGDSNTFGWDPVTKERLDGSMRWAGRLRLLLGEGYEVAEEGLGGRTVANHDPIQPGRNGLKMLRFCLETHTPLELVIVMLGTNDLKKAYHMAEMMHIPVLGIVENFSYATCPDCGKKIKIFGESHVEEAAKELSLPVLGRLPIDPAFAKAADEGRFHETRHPYLADAIEALK